MLIEYFVTENYRAFVLFIEFPFPTNMKPLSNGMTTPQYFSDGEFSLMYIQERPEKKKRIIQERLL